MWNAWARDLLSVIRKSNSRRTVIIGPAFWNNIHYLDKLKLPVEDRNIIVTVHYYLRMEFTHQGAPWNQRTATLSGIEWGTPEEFERMSLDFAGVQKWASAARRPPSRSRESVTRRRRRARRKHTAGPGPTGNSTRTSSPAI